MVVLKKYNMVLLYIVKKYFLENSFSHQYSYRFIFSAIFRHKSFMTMLMSVLFVMLTHLSINKRARQWHYFN